VRPAPLALAVAGQVGAPRDTNLPRRPRDNLLGGAGRVLEEAAEIAHRPELDGEAETVDVAAAACDLAPVIVAEAEAAGELVSRQLA
jgi:hypothetical protein